MKIKKCITVVVLIGSFEKTDLKKNKKENRKKKQF